MAHRVCGEHETDVWAPPPAAGGVGDAELDSLQHLAFHCIPQIIKRTKQVKDQRHLSFGLQIWTPQLVAWKARVRLGQRG